MHAEEEEEKIWSKWNHGDVHHSRYDTSRGGAWYVSKQAWRAEWGGFVGAQPQLHRGRRHRKRGRRRKNKLLE